MEDMFTAEEYEAMEEIWYQSMVDPLYDIAEELALKDWDE